MNPFEIALMAAQNAQPALTRGRQRNIEQADRAAIDDILANANASNNPDIINDAIGQLITRVSPAGRQDAMSYLASRQQQLQPAKPSAAQEKQFYKELEKMEGQQAALSALGRMRELRATGKLGVGSSYSPFPSTRKIAGEYQQLGKSLISRATDIPIRNRIEFETLAHQLYDPNITDATAEGILNAMERIITGGESEMGGDQQSEVVVEQEELGAIW